MADRKPLLSPEAQAFLKGETVPAAPAAAPAPPAPQPSAAEPEARVRFTVDLPRSLHKRLKLQAVDRGQPMTDLARQALAEWLEAQA